MRMGNRLTSNISFLVLLGAVVHVLLYLAANFISETILPEYSDRDSSHWFAIYLGQWLALSHKLLPGLIVGFLVQRRPMLTGFLAVFLGQLVAISLFHTSWDVPIPWYFHAFIFEGALQYALFGLVSAAAGFQVSKMRTNNSLKQDAPNRRAS